LQTLSFNNSANSSLPWQVSGFGFLKVQSCIICRARVEPRGPCPPQISGLSCYLFFKRKCPKADTIAHLKSKYLALSKFWLHYCCVWFVDQTFP